MLPQDYTFLAAVHDSAERLLALQTRLPRQLLSSPPSPTLTEPLPLDDDDGDDTADDKMADDAAFFERANESTGEPIVATDTGDSDLLF